VRGRSGGVTRGGVDQAACSALIDLARFQGMSSSNLWLGCSAIRVNIEAPPHNPKTISDNRLISLRRSIPHYPKPTSSTTRHSHSIILSHGSALIFQRKFFLLTVKARPSVRQISSLLILKEKSRDSNFARLRQLSPTIGRFFQITHKRPIIDSRGKRPSGMNSRLPRWRPACRALKSAALRSRTRCCGACRIETSELTDL
jgi:hypothetical protein